MVFAISLLNIELRVGERAKTWMAQSGDVSEWGKMSTDALKFQ